MFDLFLECPHVLCENNSDEPFRMVTFKGGLKEF